MRKLLRKGESIKHLFTHLLLEITKISFRRVEFKCVLYMTKENGSSNNHFLFRKAR